MLYSRITITSCLSNVRLFKTNDNSNLDDNFSCPVGAEAVATKALSVATDYESSKTNSLISLFIASLGAATALSKFFTDLKHKYETILLPKLMRYSGV